MSNYTNVCWSTEWNFFIPDRVAITSKIVTELQTGETSLFDAVSGTGVGTISLENNLQTSTEDLDARSPLSYKSTSQRVSVILINPPIFFIDRKSESATTNLSLKIS